MARYLAGEHHPQHALAPRAMWVAEENGAPVGYIAGHLTRRFDCDGELQWVYVVASHRRSGIATRMLQLLAKWFEGHDAHRICVDVGDEEARHFYRSVGACDLRPHWMVWKDLPAVELTSPSEG
jgi:GNAT superfamily N-acetyltransferase